jgi:N-acetylneuraminate synthase
MATAEEVEHAVSTLANSGCRDLTLLGCVSGYPTPYEQANLAVMESLGALANRWAGLNIRVGWSDHTVQPGVIHRAIHRYGAELVEFHLDLDGKGEEFEAGHCWLPESIAQVIRDVGIGVEADGSPAIIPNPIEFVEREWRADPSDGLRPLIATRRQCSP